MNMFMLKLVPLLFVFSISHAENKCLDIFVYDAEQIASMARPMTVADSISAYRQENNNQLVRDAIVKGMEAVEKKLAEKALKGERSARDAQILQMLFVEGLSTKQIAEELKVDPLAVENVTRKNSPNSGSATGAVFFKAVEAALRADWKLRDEKVTSSVAKQSVPEVLPDVVVAKTPSPVPLHDYSHLKSMVALDVLDLNLQRKTANNLISLSKQQWIKESFFESTSDAAGVSTIREVREFKLAIWGNDVLPAAFVTFWQRKFNDLYEQSKPVYFGTENVISVLEHSRETDPVAVHLDSLPGLKWKILTDTYMVADPLSPGEIAKKYSVSEEMVVDFISSFMENNERIVKWAYMWGNRGEYPASVEGLSAD